MNSDQYHKPSGYLSINETKVLSLDYGQYLYNRMVNMTSDIYTIPETGQQLQIKLYGGWMTDARGSWGCCTITLYVNGSEVRSVYTEIPFPSGSNSSTDTWNILGY